MIGEARREEALLSGDKLLSGTGARPLSPVEMSLSAHARKKGSARLPNVLALYKQLYHAKLYQAYSDST